MDAEIVFISVPTTLIREESELKLKQSEKQVVKLGIKF